MSGGSDEDVTMENNDNGQLKADKTPAASTAAGSKTPVSSGGMTMRSGRKKKRSAFTATTPSRKRASTRTAKDDDDGGTTANKKRKTTQDDDEGETNDDNVDNDVDMDESEEATDNDAEMDNNRMATATKVRFETTKEAVAAAQQLPESDEGDGEDDDNEEENGEDVTRAQAEAQALAAAAAVANNEQAAGGWRRLLPQRLRLPSQHTPGKIAASESPTSVPPPAGGRRLIFDTGVKNKESNYSTASTSRNKLLMQTRTMNAKANEASMSSFTSSVVQQPTPSLSPQQVSYRLSHELNRDFIKCTMAWLTVLLVFFTLGNVTDLMGNYAWDVRQQSVHWSEWYGLTVVDSELVDVAKNSKLDSAIHDATDNYEEEVITVVDPNLLKQANAMLRAQRMNQHDIQVFENATAEVISAINMLDSVEDEFISFSFLESSSVPSLDSSITDQVTITKYIDSLIDTQDVVVFSKSYCPYCRATKDLFQHLGIKPTVIELDEMENGSMIQEILFEMTDQDTVPNVFVKKDHIGGNDDSRELAETGKLQEILSTLDDNLIKTKLDHFNSQIGEKQQLLEHWEQALAEVEAAFVSLRDGFARDDINMALAQLSESSLVPFSAKVFDAVDIQFPGEGCKGKDYIPMTAGKENVDIDVVEGVDIDALDLAGDIPLVMDDARTAYDSLISLAQSTSESLMGSAGPSSRAQEWAEKLVEEQCQKKGVGETPSVQVNLPSSVAKNAVTSLPTAAYDARAASKDIDRLLEIEDADRTGKFDFASVTNGARVLRRGPHATSLSLYESLPLINRVLAATNLRFYGHSPEVALRPATTLYTRGHCWSFGNEFSSTRARSNTQDGLRGEYATLTVALSQKIIVTEVMIDHAPRSIVDGKNAVKNFRVIGYEDSGAFGEPWELGSFEYDSKLGMQTFAVPASVGGTNVPKLKAISLAMDSNWGGDYSCLYRFRVHGG